MSVSKPTSALTSTTCLYVETYNLSNVIGRARPLVSYDVFEEQRVKMKLPYVTFARSNPSNYERDPVDEYYSKKINLRSRHTDSPACFFVSRSIFKKV